MGNRRKARNLRLRARLGPQKGDRIPEWEIPKDEKTVIHEVPAIIHWGDIKASSRTDDEEVGRAIVYDDGTTDVIIFSGISEDAEKMIHGAKAGVDHFSIMDDEEN